MAENKGILPSSTFNTLGNNSNKWEAVYAKKIVGPLTGNVSGSSSSCTGNSATATKATQDSAGQQINSTYIKGLSISGQTITYTRGDGTSKTLTLGSSGGIKDYLLDTTGYTTFSNGFTIQWINFSIKNTTGTFNYNFCKAFTALYYITYKVTVQDGPDKIYMNSYSTTGVTIKVVISHAGVSNPSAGGTVLAIGKI